MKTRAPKARRAAANHAVAVPLTGDTRSAYQQGRQDAFRSRLMMFIDAVKDLPGGEVVIRDYEIERHLEEALPRSFSWVTLA